MRRLLHLWPPSPTCMVASFCSICRFFSLSSSLVFSSSDTRLLTTGSSFNLSSSSPLTSSNWRNETEVNHTRSSSTGRPVATGYLAFYGGVPFGHHPQMFSCRSGLVLPHELIQTLERRREATAASHTGPHTQEGRRGWEEARRGWEDRRRGAATWKVQP